MMQTQDMALWHETSGNFAILARLESPKSKTFLFFIERLLKFGDGFLLAIVSQAKGAKVNGDRCRG